MPEIYTIDLDIRKTKTYTNMTFVNGDVGANVILIKVLSNDKPLDLTAKTATVTILKPDKTKVVYNVAITEDDIVEFIPDANALSSLGTVLCTLEVYKGVERITSTKFQYKVIDSLNVADDIASFSDYPVLTGLINDVQIAIENEDQRKVNEDVRQTNENARIENEDIREASETLRINTFTINENVRISGENIRVSQENIRNTNETNRGTAETTRVTSENARIASETTRVSSENIRMSNESARQSNEAVRATQEASRVTAESTRQSNETVRVSQENIRNTNETGRVSAESIRVSQENARVLADSLRQSDWTTYKNQNTMMNDLLVRKAVMIPVKTALTITRAGLAINPLNSYNPTSLTTAANNTVVDNGVTKDNLCYLGKNQIRGLDNITFKTINEHILNGAEVI